MVFSSVVFLFYFLPVFLAAYGLLRRWRPQVVVVGSLIFYAWGDPADVLLLASFILFNWIIGLAIERATTRRRLWLALGCGGDVLALVYFKYAGFAAAQLELSFAAPLLPLGISFFTFQGISYLVDVSRRVVTAQPSLLKFAMYKAMFPQLIAGPIVRYSQIAHQIDDRSMRRDQVARGVQTFIIGLAQKVLVANTVAVAADRIFALPPDEMQASTAWLGAACYMVQIYFDFGGYSNMAIGLGAMIGFTLPRNFNDPYLARSMTDFWRRWHITLSTWFRDYLYIPLGGNRAGTVRTTCNLLITFVLCGLWHGAAWNFAAWGLYHGAFLIIERSLPRWSLAAPLWPIRHAYVVLAVLVGWVLFRADTLDRAGTMLRTMAGLGTHAAIAWPATRFATASVSVALAASVLIVIAPRLRLAAPARGVAAAAWDGAVVLSAVVMFGLSAIAISSGSYNPFIYFRF